MLKPQAQMYIFESTLYDPNYLYDFNENTANGNEILIQSDFSNADNHFTEFETNVGQFIVPESIVGRRDIKFGFCWGPWVVNMSYVDTDVLDKQGKERYQKYLERYRTILEAFYQNNKLLLTPWHQGSKLVGVLSEANAKLIKEMRLGLAIHHNRCLKGRDISFFERKPHNEVIHTKHFKKDLDRLSDELDRTYGHVIKRY